LVGGWFGLGNVWVTVREKEKRRKIAILSIKSLKVFNYEKLINLMMF